MAAGLGRGLADAADFVWETHGVHIGTGSDHVKHGVEAPRELVEEAIRRGYPSIAFVMHSPRLTRFRYQSERKTDVKFIRGERAYLGYARHIEQLRSEYGRRIQIRFGVELEWLGAGLGANWSRSKLFQAHGLDYAIGSVHFSREGIAYDDSPEETRRLAGLRGGYDGLWAGYLDELQEMVDAGSSLIDVVGHLDLPKLYAPLPDSWQDLDGPSDGLQRRLLALLEMIADHGLALDVNTAGLRRGCGIYPSAAILERARKLGIPIAIGTDCHAASELGANYAAALAHAGGSGYRYYVSFSRGIHEKRPFQAAEGEHFALLNLGIEMLNLRLPPEERGEVARFSFGGPFRGMAEVFPDSASLGSYPSLRVRKGGRSITLSDRPPTAPAGDMVCLSSHHTDTPGTLSILFNTLASEEINVETAYLNSMHDGTATAYLTLTGSPEGIREAVEFVKGTAAERFFSIEPQVRIALPPYKSAPVYLLEVDGVELPVPVSRQMVISIHANRPGVLLILLSALAARGVNVMDLQLGKRGERGYAVLGVSGSAAEVSASLSSLGPEFVEVSYIELSRLDHLAPA
jgi:HisJ family histidinol phosphate phosphatase